MISPQSDLLWNVDFGVTAALESGVVISSSIATSKSAMLRSALANRNRHIDNVPVGVNSQ